MPDDKPPEIGGTIDFLGPARLRPGELDAAKALIKTLRRQLTPIVERHGAGVVQDALISIWLELGLRGAGVAATDEYLRLLRRDLPKFAAARGARDATRGGRHDASAAATPDG